jgi:hypothetical protein
LSPGPSCRAARPGGSHRRDGTSRTGTVLRSLLLALALALGARGLGSERRTDFHLQLDLGGILNLTDRSALGGTFTLGPHHGERGGSLRYRYWAGPDLAIDLAPGAILVGDEREGRRLRLTGQVAVGINDRIGQFVQGESERDAGQLVAGLKLGSAAGLVVGGALFLFRAALQ